MKMILKFMNHSRVIYRSECARYEVNALKNRRMEIVSSNMPHEMLNKFKPILENRLKNGMYFEEIIEDDEEDTDSK